MSSIQEQSGVKNNGVLTDQQLERSRIRWVLVFYDSIVYFICWALMFVLQPSIIKPIPFAVTGVYFVAGYVFFFGFRFLLKTYKLILRYGSLRVFSRELAGDIVGAGLLLLLGLALSRGVHTIAAVPISLLLAFVAIYIIASMAMRVFYCHLYAFAKKKGAISQSIKFILKHVAFVDFDSKKPGATLRLVLEPDLPSAAPINELQNIVDKFAIRGEVTGIKQINKGYINRTYRVETLSETGHVHKYTLQRINTNVFPDVDALMENFKLTTKHLYGKLRLPGKHERGPVAMLRSTKDGCSYYKDDSGCWRMLTFFDNVYSLDVPDDPTVFYHAGQAFGSFLKEMSDVNIQDVHTVIPNFHNTKSRYQDLEQAILSDPKDRVRDILPEISFIRSKADKYGMISDALESGRIPTRVCHNDCNLNNILFDQKTDLPVAIVDLDTVMPSSPLYDFGDSMRIGTNTAKDDEKDLSKVSCNLEMYASYARGYLEACGSILTREELELLPYASLIITVEDGIRFLMDHINGDIYYNIYYPGQNLDRARTQLKLVQDMEEKLPQIKRILREIYSDLGLKAQID